MFEAYHSTNFQRYWITFVSLQVEEKVEDLRLLLPGERVAGVVSIAPDLLLNDVKTCLRPRMTRLVAALTTVKQFQGVLDSDKVTI